MAIVRPSSSAVRMRATSVGSVSAPCRNRQLRPSDLVDGVPGQPRERRVHPDQRRVRGAGVGDGQRQVAVQDGPQRQVVVHAVTRSWATAVDPTPRDARPNTTAPATYPTARMTKSPWE